MKIENFEYWLLLTGPGSIWMKYIYANTNPNTNIMRIWNIIAILRLTAFPGDAMNTPLLSLNVFSVVFCNDIADPVCSTSSVCGEILSKTSSTFFLAGWDEDLLKLPPDHQLLPPPIEVLEPRGRPFGLGLLLPNFPRFLMVPPSKEKFLEGTGGGSRLAALESAGKMCCWIICWREACSWRRRCLASRASWRIWDTIASTGWPLLGEQVKKKCPSPVEQRRPASTRRTPPTAPNLEWDQLEA